MTSTLGQVQNPSPRRKPWAKRRRRLLVALALLFLLPIVILATIRMVSNHRFESRLDAIRESGAPVYVKDIPGWLDKQAPASESVVAESTAPAEETDSVSLYLHVFDVLAKRQTTPDMPDITALLSSLSKNGKLTESELAELRKYLAANEEVLALLLEAAKLAPGRFPLDYSKGYAMELSHLARLRESERILSAASFLAAVDGDKDRAFEALMAGFAVSRPLEREPILISQLVRYASNGITIDAVSNTLGLVAYTDEQLAELQLALAASTDPRALTNAFITERTFGIEAFENPADIIGAGKTFLDDLIPGATSTLIQTANAVGMFSGDREEFLTCMDEMIQASTLPFPESRAAMGRITQQLGSPFLIPSLSQMMIPSLERTPEAMAANEARVESCCTAAAIERYTLANGAPPAQLEALVPQFLHEVPLDPFDQQPLRYRHDGNGYTLYSVGYNGVDDGGAPLGNREPLGGNREGDIVFRRQ